MRFGASFADAMLGKVRGRTAGLRSLSGERPVAWLQCGTDWMGNPPAGSGPASHWKGPDNPLLTGRPKRLNEKTETAGRYTGGILKLPN